MLKKHENCIELYGQRTLDSVDQQWMSRKITVGISNPHDICFGPNNRLVVSDIGDTSVKIFYLGEGQNCDWT